MEKLRSDHHEELVENPSVLPVFRDLFNGCHRGTLVVDDAENVAADGVEVDPEFIFHPVPETGAINLDCRAVVDSRKNGVAGGISDREEGHGGFLDGLAAVTIDRGRQFGC